MTSQSGPVEAAGEASEALQLQFAMWFPSMRDPQKLDLLWKIHENPKMKWMMAALLGGSSQESSVGQFTPVISERFPQPMQNQGYDLITSWDGPASAATEIPWLAVELWQFA